MWTVSQGNPLKAISHDVMALIRSVAFLCFSTDLIARRFKAQRLSFCPDNTRRVFVYSAQVQMCANGLDLKIFSQFSLPSQLSENYFRLVSPRGGMVLLCGTIKTLFCVFDYD